MNYDRVNFGRRIREERELLDLSIEAFSELTGVSRSMLAQMESGIKGPSVETLGKVANGIDKPGHALLLDRNEWTKELIPNGEIANREFIEDVVDIMLRLTPSEAELIRNHCRLDMNYFLKENNS